MQAIDRRSKPSCSNAVLCVTPGNGRSKSACSDYEDRGSKRTFSDCVLSIPFILKSKQMLAKYMPGMRNGNVEIRIASSSAQLQLRRSPLDLFALFTESNFFYEAMGYQPGNENHGSKLSTVPFPKHLNMTDFTMSKSGEMNL